MSGFGCLTRKCFLLFIYLFICLFIYLFIFRIHVAIAESCMEWICLNNFGFMLSKSPNSVQQTLDEM